MLTPIACPVCNSENNHIRKVIVETGDDEYRLTDRIIITACDNQLMSKQQTPLDESSDFRLRGEPSVSITMLCEENSHQWQVVVSHHKGGVFIKQPQ